MTLTINVEKINENAVMPEFAHDTDSGFDLFTCSDIIINGGEKTILPTGLKFELPIGYGVQIKNKSGITIKGCPISHSSGDFQNEDGSNDLKLERADVTVYEGTIDMMYRGEIGIMVKNEEKFAITIPMHTKIAQGVIREVITCNFVEVDAVSTDTSRGEKGYGSSGIRK